MDGLQCSNRKHTGCTHRRAKTTELSKSTQCRNRLRLSDTRFAVTLLTLCVWVLIVLTREVNASKNSGRLFKERKIEIVIPSITVCPDVDTKVKDMRYEWVNGSSRANGTIVSMINSLSKVVATLTRCKRQCEHFQTWRFRAGCDVLEKKDTFWASFLGNIKPTVKCPLKPGFYSTNNSRINANLLFALPFQKEEAKWRVRAEGYDGDQKLVICFNIQVNLEQSNHNNAKN